MITRHYYIGLARYTQDGQFCGNSWEIRSVRSWKANPVAVVQAYLAETREALPDQQIHVTSIQRL